MSLLNLKYSQVTRALEQKLSLPFRSGGDRSGWYHLDGVPVLRVTIPKEKGGRDSLAKGTANQIRNQLKLEARQFRDLAVCPMSGSDYEQIIRGKQSQGLL